MTSADKRPSTAFTTIDYDRNLLILDPPVTKG